VEPDGLFRCVPLKCRLTRKLCGERHVRAEALQSDGEGGWSPQRWSHLALACRGCKIGAAHADALGVHRPDLEEIKLRKPPKAILKNCCICHAVFKPSSNRQKSCPRCSTSRRFKRLREENRAICFVCGKEYCGADVCALCGTKKPNEQNPSRKQAKGTLRNETGTSYSRCYTCRYR
jgi:hypothetical protein